MTSVKELKERVKARGLKVSGRKISKITGKAYQDFFPMHTLQKMLDTGVQATFSNSKVASKTRKAPKVAGTRRMPPKVLPKKHAAAKHTLIRSLAKLRPGYDARTKTTTDLHDNFDSHFAFQTESGDSLDARNVARFLKKQTARHDYETTSLGKRVYYTPGSLWLTPTNVHRAHALTGRSHVRMFGNGLMTHMTARERRKLGV